MAWSYSGDPASSARDEIRFMIGDTDEADQQLQDAEIDYLVTLHADAGAANHLAASDACQALASKYAKMSDRTVGSLSISYSQRHSQYLAMAVDFSAKAAQTGQSAKKVGPPILGGGGLTYLGGDRP